MDAEVSVKAWEQRYGFQRTVWDVQSERYQTNRLSAVDKRRKNLLCKMRQQSSERKYLISTLRKYGGDLKMFIFSEHNAKSTKLRN